MVRLSLKLAKDLLILQVIISFQHQVADGKLMIRSQSDFTLERIFKEIVTQHNFAGATMYSAIRHNGTCEPSILRKITKALSRSTTLLKLNSRFSSKRFQYTQMRKHKRTGVFEKIINGISTGLVETGQTFLVYVTDKPDNLKQMKHLGFLVTRLTPSWRTSRVLVISIRQAITKRTNLKEIFTCCYSKFRFNFDAVSITLQSSESSIALRCKVHQYNPFTKNYTVNVYRQGVKWFSDETKELNRAAFKIGLLKRKQKLCSLCKHRLGLMFDLIKTMNGTPALRMHKSGGKLPDVVFPEYRLLPFSGGWKYIKPNKFQSGRLFVPVFRSVKVNYDFSEFFKALALLTLITTIFFVVSRLAHFDSNTWSVLAILEMITGNSNARNPLTRAEVWAFFTMILVGFYFGVDLVTGLTSTVLVEETEVKLESYDDVKIHNLTLHLTMYVAGDFLRKPSFKQIRDLDISIVKQQDLNLTTTAKQIDYRKNLIRQIISGKNVSFANTWFQSQEALPKRFIVNHKVQAELSDITLWQDVLSCVLPPTSLFVERLSDLRWRATETKLFDEQIIGESHERDKLKYEIYQRTIAEYESSDENLESCIDVKSLLFLLAFSWSLAIFSLLVEFLVEPRVEREQKVVVPGVIEAESDDDSSEFDFDQAWVIEEGA